MLELRPSVILGRTFLRHERASAPHMGQYPSDDDSPPAGARRLNLFDATAIIVGIVIGAGIYESSPRIALFVAGEFFADGWAPADWSLALPLAVLCLWLAGAVVAWLGALCFAELATAFPDHGGGYAYLTRAFGPRWGLAFAWAEFWVVRPGNIGAIAFVFARYFGDPLGLQAPPWATAAGAVLAITVLNALGFHTGRWTQNVLTSAKVLGLAAVVLLGLFVCRPPAETADLAVRLKAWDGPGVAVAFVLVMFAFGGWSDMPYVAAEVREPRRNLGRALMLGTAVTTAIYLATNLAFLLGLGWGDFLPLNADGVPPAQLVVARSGGQPLWINVLICVSCLSAVNGMVFTGGRLYYAVGQRHAVFSLLGGWSAGRSVPVAAILAQGAITALLIALFGLRDNAESFAALVVFTGPFYWGFILLSVGALLVLRASDGLPAERFRAPLYPLTPLLFMAACGWMIWSSVLYAANNLSFEVWWAVLVVVSGAAAVFVDGKARSGR